MGLVMQQLLPYLKRAWKYPRTVRHRRSLGIQEASAAVRQEGIMALWATGLPKISLNSSRTPGTGPAWPQGKKAQAHSFDVNGTSFFEPRVPRILSIRCLSLAFHLRPDKVRYKAQSQACYFEALTHCKSCRMLQNHFLNAM